MDTPSIKKFIAKQMDSLNKKTFEELEAEDKKVEAELEQINNEIADKYFKSLPAELPPPKREIHPLRRKRVRELIEEMVLDKECTLCVNDIILYARAIEARECAVWKVKNKAFFKK